MLVRAAWQRAVCHGRELPKGAADRDAYVLRVRLSTVMASGSTGLRALGQDIFAERDSGMRAVADSS